MYTLAIDKRSYDTGYACNDLLAIHTCNTLKYGTRVFVSKFNLCYYFVLFLKPSAIESFDGKRSLVRI